MYGKKLNKDQLEAVNHGSGPLLIIAGAGTGKTTVITERVKRLISDGLANPSEILALTFTEKSAAEMEERIDQALPLGYTQMWIMTFHSFCDRILRDEAIHIGLSPDYKLLTPAGSIALMQKHLLDLDLDYFSPLGNPNKFISGLLTHFDRLRDEDIQPAGYSVWVEKKCTPDDSPEAVQYRELATVFTYFQKLKQQENALDFADLISYTLQLFRTRPHILEKYQNQFKYLLVDEYQDTNFAQNQLVNLLAGLHQNLTVVADDDQSIYRWRGAAVSNVIQFKKTYPKSKLVVLTQNYRSTQEILDAAYKLIQNNNPDRLEVKEKIDKRLKSEILASGETPQHLHFSRVEDEAEGVAKLINQLAGQPGSLYEPKDIAILVRANAHARTFLSTLSRLGVPVQFLGPGKLFDQPEIKDLIALLRVIKDPSDSISLLRVLSMNYFSLPQDEIITLANYAGKQNLSLYEVCNQIQALEIKLSADTKTKVSDLAGQISALIKESLKLTAGQLLFNFLQTTGILKAILDYQLPIDETAAQNIMKFFAKLKNFESENSEAGVRPVLDWIDLSLEVGESPAVTQADWTQNNAVNILTLHSAKGLEFPVVFLVNLVVGRFPSLERREQIPVPDELIKEDLPSGDFHLQEERRLFYVGVTRAQKQLFLTSADLYGEAKRIKKPSPFITEALGSLNIKLTSQPITDQLSILDWQPPQFSILNSQFSIKVSYLSYSQIQTFLDCPLHYKAKYILKIPSPPSAASSFGNTIHKTLKDYYQAIKTHQKVNILDVYTHDWSPEGYHNPQHAQKYFDLGKKYLMEFLAEPLSKKIPHQLEESFTVPLGPDLKIGGKIDRVDILEDGIIEIIDYKTSSRSLTEKEAMTDLQLSIYALAASQIPTAPFGKKPEKIKLSLYYFADQKKVSVFHTSAQLKIAKNKILEYAQEIERSDFHCSQSLICQSKCDYRVLCDIDKP